MTHLLLAMPVAVPQIDLLPPPFGSGDIKKDLPPRHWVCRWMLLLDRCFALCQYPIIQYQYQLLDKYVIDIDIGQHGYPISISIADGCCCYLRCDPVPMPTHQSINENSSPKFISPGLMPWGYMTTRPGKHTKSYWTWPFIVDFPINSMVISHSYVSLPEGTHSNGNKGSELQRCAV